MTNTESIIKQINSLKAQPFNAIKPHVNQKRITQTSYKECSWFDRDSLTELLANPEFTHIEHYDDTIYVWFLKEETLEEWQDRLAKEYSLVKEYEDRKQKWQERIDRRIAILESGLSSQENQEYAEYIRLKQKYA